MRNILLSPYIYEMQLMFMSLYFLSTKQTAHIPGKASVAPFLTLLGRKASTDRMIEWGRDDTELQVSSLHRHLTMKMKPKFYLSLTNHPSIVSVEDLPYLTHQGAVLLRNQKQGTLGALLI